MSAVNPTHIIAEHRAQLVHAHAHSLISIGATMNLECLCGGFATAGPYSVDEMYALHAAHVVSKLTDAGYSIVPSDGIVRTYQAASTLGHKYMSPRTFGCDREEAERWFALHQKMLDGLPGVDTVRLEYRDEYATGWLPLTAAAAEEDTND